MIILILTVFGLLMGSFLNVVIYRLPIMLKALWRKECLEVMGQVPEEQEPFNLAYPRSKCPHCQQVIAAYYNIPIFSFIMLRGQCAMCHHPISKRYPIIEAITAILSGFLAWHYGLGTPLVASLILTYSLIAITMIDYDEQLIPDWISLPLLWMGLLFNLHNLFTTLDSAVIGAVVGYSSLWLFTHIYYLITGKFGMGHGDFKLLAVFGAWLGLGMLPFIIICSSLVGAAFGLILMATGLGDRQTTVPFGPYLAVAGWIALLWGNTINTLYLNHVFA